MKTTALAAALLLVACGPETPEPCTSADFTLPSGMCVDLATLPPELRPEIEAHLENVVQAGLAWWGAQPADVAGWKVVFNRDPIYGYAAGLTVWRYRMVALMLPPGVMDGAVPACAEFIAGGLPHEIGHVVIGDANHLDPRWADEGLIDTAMEVAAGARCGW